MESNDRFVQSKLALLNRGTRLDAQHVDQAWVHLSRQILVAAEPKAPWRWPVAAAVVFTVLALGTPSVRVWAQGAWSRVELSRTENIQLDLQFTTPNLLLPNVFPFYPPEQNQRWSANSAAAASGLAGFDVKILTSALVPHDSRIQVIVPPAIQHLVQLAAVQSDLQRFGRVLPSVPAGIDNATVVLEPQGRAVWSFYGDCPEIIGPGKACAMLIQSRPMLLRLPSTVSPEEYTRFSLELAGLSTADARRLAGWSRTKPTLFLPLETRSEIRRVQVAGGNGTLIVYARAANGETAFVLDWQKNDISYRLYGRGPENAIAVAESMR